MLVPGGAGEAEIARFIADWLEKAGLEVELVETAPGRPNVVGIARGTGGGRSLILNGHMDTVGTGEMQRAHTPAEKDGRLYGRGAYDMKGGLAACMLAAAEARKLRPARRRDPAGRGGRGVCQHRHAGAGAEVQGGRRHRGGVHRTAK